MSSAHFASSHKSSISVAKTCMEGAGRCGVHSSLQLGMNCLIHVAWTALKRGGEKERKEEKEGKEGKEGRKGKRNKQEEGTRKKRHVSASFFM